MHAETTESILSGLNLVLNNVISRQAKGQALAGRTILSMSLTINPPWITRPQWVYMQSLLQAIMNRGVICVCSAGNFAETLGFPRTGYPAALATTAFPLITVGAVDVTGAVASFSQEGMVYTVGVDSPCAAYNSYLMEDNADGTSGGEPLE